MITDADRCVPINSFWWWPGNKGEFKPIIALCVIWLDRRPPLRTHIAVSLLKETLLLCTHMHCLSCGFCCGFLRQVSVAGTQHNRLTDWLSGCTTGVECHSDHRLHCWVSTQGNRNMWQHWTLRGGNEEAKPDQSQFALCTVTFQSHFRNKVRVFLPLILGSCWWLFRHDTCPVTAGLWVSVY